MTTSKYQPIEQRFITSFHCANCQKTGNVWYYEEKDYRGTFVKYHYWCKSCNYLWTVITPPGAG